MAFTKHSFMKTQKIIYWIATGLLCALMLFSASMYFLKTGEVRAEFTRLGHPEHVVIPLAILKLLGIGAILSKVSTWAKEWAYAGFTFNVILAWAAHGHAGDGWVGPSLIGIVLVAVSYYYDGKLFGNASTK